MDLLRESRPNLRDSTVVGEGCVQAEPTAVRSARPRLPWPITIPLTILAVLSLIAIATDIDRYLSATFYSEATASWHVRSRPHWKFISHYGIFPGLSIGVAGTLLALSSGLWRLNFKPGWRRHGLFLAIVLIVANGLIINLGFKGHFGRPRPREVVDFGGYTEFRTLFVPGEEGNNSSFPSGHASMGFYIMACGFVLHRHRNTARFVLILGVLAGWTVGMARIAQGAHFFSDVVWSGGFVYLTSHACFALLYRQPDESLSVARHHEHRSSVVASIPLNARKSTTSNAA